METRSKHDWKVPYKINQMIDQKWYQKATAKNDNKDLYSKHIKRAEEILFKNIPEEVIAVEFVNNREETIAKGVAKAIARYGDGVHDVRVKCPL